MTRQHRDGASFWNRLNLSLETMGLSESDLLERRIERIEARIAAVESANDQGRAADAVLDGRPNLSVPA